MVSGQEWIYHTLKDEARSLDSNNFLLGCRNVLWELLRRSVDAWEMHRVLIARGPSVLYLKGDKVQHPFTVNNFCGKTNCGQTSRRSDCVFLFSGCTQHNVVLSAYEFATTSRRAVQPIESVEII